MEIALFSAKPFERAFFEEANAGRRHTLRFLEARLGAETAGLAQGASAVCAFVNDLLDAPCLERLRQAGVRLVALRSAGFNHVDLAAAARLGLPVVRVPAYSPHAVAEHTVALMLCLNRKLHRAFNRVREGNFALDGLLGFDMAGKTAGIVGTGKIGRAVAGILHGMGCRLLATDVAPDPACEALGVSYVEFETLARESDLVTLHCPLTPATRHLIGERTLSLMKPGVMVVNTGRGGLIDTAAVIRALKSGRIGSLALDVYEEEASLFFEDRSREVIQDDVFARLLTFPNVLITGHQGFFTREALQAIAHTTLANVSEFEAGGPLTNAVAPA